MRVFVTGATGYIGSAVAGAFARAGHETYGLVRSPEKGRRLGAAEVEPVVGTMQDPDAWIPFATDCQALVHCAVEYSAATWDLHGRTLDALLGAARQCGRPRTLIVTSGVWVYGDTGTDFVDETAMLNPPTAVEKRPAFDQRVLDEAGGPLRTLVIRPGCVYGGAGGLTGSWFASAEAEGSARVVGDGENRWAMVHAADLADLYVRAAESGLSGEVLNATDRSRFTVMECARAASRVAGSGGRVTTLRVAEAETTMGAMAACLAMTQHVDSSKAVRLLGWQPRHGGFVDGVERYYLGWKNAGA